MHLPGIYRTPIASEAVKRVYELFRPERMLFRNFVFQYLPGVGLREGA